VSEAAAVYARLAEQWADVHIDVVAGPTTNGVVVSQWVAYYLSEQQQHPVLAVYAEEQGVIMQRVFRRGYDTLLAGKRVLVVTDVLRTGGTARKMTTAVQAAGGKVVGMAAVCNRGGLTAAELGVPHLYTLVDVSMDAWDETACPLCRAGVPVNTNVGKGAAFLERQSSA
jgi:orotate phosphoribosyltransferase